jgi:putative phosphoesterase
MRIGLMSDTHGFLDEAVFTYFDQCDEIWHAGDFGTMEVFNRLTGFKTLRGVYGNVDGAELRKVVTGELDWMCEDVRVYMTHIGGYPGHYERGIQQELRDRKPALFLCGHSHILKIMRDAALGLVHMNPGACGHNGWHQMRTLVRFSIDGERIHKVEAIELGPRGHQLAKMASKHA